jgi:hypothetical protein
LARHVNFVVSFILARNFLDVNRKHHENRRMVLNYTSSFFLYVMPHKGVLLS